MVREEILRVLLSEIHKEIETAALLALHSFCPSQQGAEITYPPGESLTEAEKSALRDLTLSPNAHSALKKLITDAVSAPIFHLFSLMDGVADPESGDFESWPGVGLAEKCLEPEHEGDMLHDEFYSSYRDYKST